MLNESGAIDLFKELQEIRAKDQARLALIHDYTRNKQKTTWLPSGVPQDVQRLAVISRVNFMPLIIRNAVQSLYVDGFRTPGMREDQPVWDFWQKNKLDARQIGIHRAAVKFGVGYATALPGTFGGESVPVIRGASPMKLTAAYAEDDDDWPRAALQQRRTTWRVIDEDAVYTFGREEFSDVPEFTGSEQHGIGVCPVVRFRDDDDLDAPVVGQVEPYMELQDQINVTTFCLLVAQHYSAHRQRYILGWMAENEEAKLKASASKLWTFDVDPGDVQIGEFAQTEVSGMLNSRERSIHHLAALSQTPVSELIAEIVNLSADALEIAQASRTRLLSTIKTMCGESWEQVLGLSAEMGGLDIDPAAWVWWRDTEVRSLSQDVDALMKMASPPLNIPADLLLSRIPGVTLQEVTQWVNAREEMALPVGES